MLKNWVIVASLAFVVACGGKKDDEKRAKLADLCVKAGDQLKQDSSNADNDTFEQMLTNALMACSSACDLSDQPSCKALNDHVAKICGVSPDMCKQLCTTVKSDSLKKATCDFKK